MKTLKYLVVAAFVLTMALRSSAQVVHPVPPVLPTSEATMRAYLLEQVEPVYASLQSPSAVQSERSYLNTNYIRSAAGTDPAEILNLLGSKELFLEVANPADECQSHAVLYNRDSDILLSGSIPFFLVKGEKGYSIPSGGLAPELKINCRSPIYFGKNAQNVRVIVRNDDGNIDYSQSRYLERGRSEQFYYSCDFFQRKGEVIVDYWAPGTNWTRVFNLADGIERNTTEASGSLKPTMPGVVSFRNGDMLGHIRVFVTNGIPPTIVVTEDSGSWRQIVISVPGNIGRDANGNIVSWTNLESPDGVWIWQEGFSDNKEWVPLQGEYPMHFFRQGTSFMVPEWPRLGHAIPVSSGGGSVISTPVTPTVFEEK